MAKTHYYPYSDDECEYGACGTYLSEYSGVTMNWPNVTCKKCVKQRENIEKSLAFDEEQILKQMAGMVDFWNKENE